MASNLTPETATERKARGAFYTPADICQFIARWAIRSAHDRVLEPSCGDANFLVAAGERLVELGSMVAAGSLTGVEIEPRAADLARARLHEHGLPAEIRVADFLASQHESYDAIVGNPPYIRFQAQSPQGRAAGVEAALAQGVRLSAAASSWASFVIHSCSLLKTGGRLGLVLPAELLSVAYAATVRQYLLKRFASVELVMFEHLVFDDAQEDVVLLLAEGEGGTSVINVRQVRDAAALALIDTTEQRTHNSVGGERWTRALVSPTIFEAYQELSTSRAFETLSQWGSVYLGGVTGQNKFFALSDSHARRASIVPDNTKRIWPPGQLGVTGLSLTDADWQFFLDHGKRVRLFYPNGDLDHASSVYAAHGVDAGVSSTFKCSSRAPWWRVPLVATPDLIFTSMSHVGPRLIDNAAELDILNSLYGIKLLPERKRLGRSLLPMAALNSLTLLGAEMVGRGHGGGLLKLEPRDADLLPLPSAAMLVEVEGLLNEVRDEVDALLRGNRASRAVEIIDAIVLSRAAGISDNLISTLREGAGLLFSRRTKKRAVGKR